MALHPNRQQWFVILVGYAAIVFAYGHDLFEETDRLVLLIVLGVALLTWRLSRPVEHAIRSVAFAARRWWKPALALVALAVLLMVASELVKHQRDTTSAASLSSVDPFGPDDPPMYGDSLFGPGSEPLDRTPVARMAAIDLMEEYAANEFAADETYRERYVRVSGVVERIGRDEFGVGYVSLALRGRIVGVNARFLRGKKDLTKIQNGKFLTVDCTPLKNKGQEVFLNHCFLGP